MSKKKLNDLSALGGFVYSTDPDYKPESEHDIEEEYPEPGKQKLYISLDKKNRGGKAVTLIEGFQGNEADFAALAKELKVLCGAGGNAKDAEIVIQGDFREKISSFLLKKGFKMVKKGA